MAQLVSWSFMSLGALLSHFAASRTYSLAHWMQLLSLLYWKQLATAFAPSMLVHVVIPLMVVGMNPNLHWEQLSTPSVPSLKDLRQLSMVTGSDEQEMTL